MNNVLPRREFLRTSATALLGGSLADIVVGSAAESDQSYRGPVIDTHTHFYDPTRAQGVPWPSKDDKLLYRAVLPPEYRALPKPQPVTGTVVVEASVWVEDNQWILDLAARDPFIVGFVGHLELDSSNFAANLARFAANKLFRGLRIGAGQVRRVLNEASLMRQLQRVAERGLAVDLLGGPDMLEDVARLAKAMPELRLMIDHVANVRIDGQAAGRAWREGMLAAGQQTNVFCKVSGLVEGTGRIDGGAPADVAFYRPVLETIWEAFGVDRLVYGSNWPVSARFAPCAVVQAIIAAFFMTKGPEAAAKVFSANGQACYRWMTRA